MRKKITMDSPKGLGFSLRILSEKFKIIHSLKKSALENNVLLNKQQTLKYAF